MKQKDADREFRKFIREWLPKYVERGRVFLENLENRKAIKEEDWDVLKAYHRSYYFGYCPDFILPYKPPQKESKQTTIFDNMTEFKKTDEEVDRMAVENAEKGIGENFDIEILEPTIVIENDTDKEV
jgi:hypothetical protein